MAQIEPFKAIRYGQEDLSDLIAPPYDVLSRGDKRALLKQDDHNIVAIDLPHIPPKKAGPDRAYAQAAGDLTCWIDIRTLIHDEAPALYAYHQTYKLGAKTLTRKKFFARLRLEPLGTGKVFAHEQTFGGPKEDRLKLTTATRCNLSPIFALYPDPDNEVAGLIDMALDEEPDQWGTLDGVVNKLWIIDDLPTIKSIQVRLSNKPVFIADGHHRYDTALMYRQKHVDEIGEPAVEDPINYVLVVLGGMEDPGATIRPYFRSIRSLPHLTAAALKQALDESFTRKATATPTSADRLRRTLSRAGPQAIALYVAKEDACAVIVPKDPDLLAAAAPDRQPAWRQLAYSILHHYVIDHVIGPQFNEGKIPNVHYHKTLEEAIKDARGHSGVAALMPATTMAQLREICTAGELMPQKSTYFHPKLATGMVINPLY
ncbi:MAG: DUF1015 family protein [Phycisphaerae bacterium]